MILVSLVAAGLLATALASAVALGMRIPRSHRAERSVEIRADPERVWSLVADCRTYPGWVPRVVAAGRALPPDERTWVLSTPEGPMTIEVFGSPAERLFVARIVDDGLPFGGTWSYRVATSPIGTRVTLVEDGWMDNPLFRFFARYVFGYERTIDETLVALKKAAER